MRVILVDFAASEPHEITSSCHHAGRIYQHHLLNLLPSIETDETKLEKPQVDNAEKAHIHAHKNAGKSAYMLRAQFRSTTTSADVGVVPLAARWHHNGESHYRFTMKVGVRELRRALSGIIGPGERLISGVVVHFAASLGRTLSVANRRCRWLGQG